MENIIRTILREKGLRMSDLANRVGMSQSNLVASLRNNPKLSTLVDICHALGIEMAELFGGKAEKSEGVIILGGQTFSVLRPTIRTVQFPTYTVYSALRNDIKRFVKDRISSKNTGVICGMVEDFEFFNLAYDHNDISGSQELVYEKFILSICFGNKQVWTNQYDLYEYSRDGEAIWDIPSVISEITNDIEGYVLSHLKAEQ